MGRSVVCILYVLLVIGIALARTRKGRMFLRNFRDFAALPSLAAVVLLAVLGLLFSVC